MTEIEEGDLIFKFSIDACKYDNWSFYRSQFIHHCGRENKAVDFLAYDKNISWIIEVKDYRQSPRKKSSKELVNEITIKVRDTLAGLVAAQINAHGEEKSFAQTFLKQKNIRVVCHIEQPRNPSKLFPTSIIHADLRDELRRQLKALDPHPFIMNKDKIPPNCSWSVR